MTSQYLVNSTKRPHWKMWDCFPFCWRVLCDYIVPFLLKLSVIIILFTHQKDLLADTNWWWTSKVVRIKDEFYIQLDSNEFVLQKYCQRHRITIKKVISFTFKLYF